MRKAVLTYLLILMPVFLQAESRRLVVGESSDTLAPCNSGFRFDGKLGRKPLRTALSQTFASKDLDFSPNPDFRRLYITIPGALISESGAPGYNAVATYMNGNALQLDGFLVDPYEIHPSVSEISEIKTVGSIVDRYRLGMGNGVYVTTKSEERDGHHVSAGFESAFLLAGRTAKWCNGEDFARMMNQARVNAGLPELYSEEQIREYAKSDPLSREFPSVDLRSETIRDWRTSQKAYVSMSGKEGRTSYYANVNWLRDGDNLRIGPVSDFNALNVRGNVKTNFTRELSLEVHSFLNLRFRRSPNAGFNMAASVTPPVEYPLTLGTDEEQGQTIYGVSKTVPNSYYAALMESGSRTSKYRSGSVNAVLEYNFGKFVPGLSARTDVRFLLSGTTTDGSVGDYLASYYDEVSGNWLPSSVHQGVKSSAKSVLGTSFNHLFEFQETLRYSYWRGNHRVMAEAWAKIREHQYPGQRARSATISASCDYAWKDRYMVQAVLYVPGSTVYRKSERFAAGAACGLAWVLSNEEWLPAETGVDHLKLMAQAGFGPLDVVSSQYLFLDSYVKSGSFTSGVSSVDYDWIAQSGNSVSKPGTVISRLGNSSLGRGHQIEANAGIEAAFLGRRLNFFASYVYIHDTGLLTDANAIYPDFYGMNGMTTYINWNAKKSHLLNVGLNWNDRKGRFSYGIGYWVNRQSVIWDKYLETVINDYSKVEGTYTSAIRGYTCLGKFASEEEIAAAPKQNFDVKTFPGDLRYKDVDGNGVIDSNDISVIVKDAAGLWHNLRLQFSYGRASLLAIFRARTGSTVNLLSSGYYSGGRGYVNYTEWMRENVGGDYPRLAYEGNNGNFVTSGFWLRSGDFLKLANLEFSFSFPKCGLRLFARGENLFCIDDVKDLDPENLAAGYSTYALNRTISLGINIGIR